MAHQLHRGWAWSWCLLRWRRCLLPLLPLPPPMQRSSSLDFASINVWMALSRSLFVILAIFLIAGLTLSPLRSRSAAQTCPAAGSASCQLKETAHSAPEARPVAAMRVFG